MSKYCHFAHWDWNNLTLLKSTALNEVLGNAITNWHQRVLDTSPNGQGCPEPSTASCYFAQEKPVPKVFVPCWLVSGFVLKYQLQNYQQSLRRLLFCNIVLGFKNLKGFGRGYLWLSPVPLGTLGPSHYPATSSCSRGISQHRQPPTAAPQPKTSSA